MHHEQYPLDSYICNIHTDISHSANNMVDPPELQFNSAIIDYVQLPPHNDTDNNDPTNYNTNKTNDYTVVKDGLKNNCCIHLQLHIMIF